MRREVPFVPWPLTKTSASLFCNSSLPKLEIFALPLSLAVSLFVQAARTLSRKLFYSVLPINFTPAAVRWNFLYLFPKEPTHMCPKMQKGGKNCVELLLRGVIDNAERAQRECIVL